MSMQYTYTKKLLYVYLKFKLNRVSCILPTGKRAVTATNSIPTLCHAAL